MQINALTGCVIYIKKVFNEWKQWVKKSTNLKNEKTKTNKKTCDEHYTWKRVHKKSLYYKFYAIYFLFELIVHIFCILSHPTSISVGLFVCVCAIGIYFYFSFIRTLNYPNSLFYSHVFFRFNFNRFHTFGSSTNFVDENWFSLHCKVHDTRMFTFFCQFNQKLDSGTCSTNMAIKEIIA